MPPSTAIDTHAYYKRLTAAGMEPCIAEAVTQESTHQLGELATKEDIRSLLDSIERESNARKNDMEALRIARKEDMEALIDSMQNRIETAKKDLTIRLGGLMMALSGIIIAAIKLL